MSPTKIITSVANNNSPLPSSVETTAEKLKNSVEKNPQNKNNTRDTSDDNNPEHAGSSARIKKTSAASTTVVMFSSGLSVLWSLIAGFLIQYRNTDMLTGVFL